MRGMQSQAEGDHDAALTWFEKARSIQPKNKSLAARLGHNRLAVKRWKEAESYFQEAIDHDPGDAAAHLGLARSLMPQRHHWEALDALLSAIALHYYNPPSHYLLGVVLHRLGKLPAAIEALSVCLAQNPNYAQAYDRLAYIYRNRFDNEEEARRQEQLAIYARKRIRDLQEGARMPDTVLRESLRNRLAYAKRLLALQETPTLLVNHAECIREPSATAQAINAFLGGTLDEDAMANVVNPQLTRKERSGQPA